MSHFILEPRNFRSHKITSRYQKGLVESRFERYQKIYQQSHVHFESLLHLFRYIIDNKNLGLECYAKIEDAPLSVLLIHASINTDNQLMLIYGSR